MTNHPGDDDMSGMDSGGMAMNTMMKCDGSAVPERQGNWQGHVLPGTIFIIWAAHWMISATWRYLTAQRSGRAYHARSTESLLPMIPALNGVNRYPIESILKAVGGILLFVLQISYGGYKNLICPDDVRVDRIVTQHLNSWSHASMNLGFALSGLVELAGHHVKFPQGTYLALLSGSFLIEAMLFSLHEKNGALDQTVHWLLAQSIWTAAVFTALETAYPENYMLSLGRVFGQLLQGIWFCQVAVILFGGKPVWDDKFDGHEDEAPAMFLPMIFVYYMLLAVVLMVTAYAGIETVHKRLHGSSVDTSSGSPVYAGLETSRLLSEEEGREVGVKSVPLSTLRRA